MLTKRPSQERGHANHGWLDTFHSFSFAGYYDPTHMGFRSLRVINEDRVDPDRGFETHPHSDMEIITYVLEGALKHQDSMGNGSIIRPGDVQRMSAGTGVLHSEINASREENVHLLQIWILPDQEGLDPSYEQKHFTPDEKYGRLRLVASKNGRDGSVTIHQDADLYAAVLDPNQSVTHQFQAARAGWIQVARGKVTLDGSTLNSGDGAALQDVQTVQIVGLRPSEILLFDLA